MGKRSGGGDATRFWPDARRKRSSWARFVPLWAGAALVGTVYGAGGFGSLPTSAANHPVRASFGYCHTGGGTNCVVDGDTIWLGGEKIRVADIDAPETHPARCATEQALGDRAARRLRQLLNQGAVSLAPVDRDRDRYGRKLRIVLVDGRSVGDRLVGEGLARPYAGGRRPWC
jgi:endonuclease YncB( thermonuclease family)